MAKQGIATDPGIDLCSRVGRCSLIPKRDAPSRRMGDVGSCSTDFGLQVPQREPQAFFARMFVLRSARGRDLQSKQPSSGLPQDLHPQDPGVGSVSPLDSPSFRSCGLGSDPPIRIGSQDTLDGLGTLDREPGVCQNGRSAHFDRLYLDMKIAWR